jgi:hypothetical protein
MKNFGCLILFFAVLGRLSAQGCDLPLSSIDIYGNNIKARVLNGGDLFAGFGSAQFFPNPNPNSSTNPATIYSAGLWMGGIDPAGNLQLSAVTYRSTGSGSKGDYSAGPLANDGTTNDVNCTNWDKHFIATSDEINLFQSALSQGGLSVDSALAKYPSIMGWPGRDNPHFSTIWGFDLPSNSVGLAPFFDADENGSYNPMQGDYPVVQLRGQAPFVPAVIVWCVFNDEKGGTPHTTSFGKAFRNEIQLTVWAMQSAQYPILNNTLFTSHKIIHKGTEAVDSTFMGLWVDFDLGCYLDDYIGCAPDLNTFYVYNQDGLDGQPGNTCPNGGASFLDSVPVQAVTLLGQTMDKFMYFNGENGQSQTADPVTPPEYYNYMSGSWRDGSPLTFSDNGFGGNVPTDYAFPDDPSGPNGWSMCTANLPFADRRVLGIHKIGTLMPGQIEELNAAWHVTYAPPPCNVGNTLTNAEELIDIYESGFSTVSRIPEVAGAKFNLYPNPASQAVVIAYSALQVSDIRVFDAKGNLVEVVNNIPSEQTTLDLARYKAGIYYVQIITEQGIGVKKMAIVR